VLASAWQPTLPLAAAAMMGAGGKVGLSPWIRDQLLALGSRRAAELRSGARREVAPCRGPK
jgi:hypothetical protein